MRGRKKETKIHRPVTVHLEPAPFLKDVGRKYFSEIIERLAQIPGMLEQTDDHALNMLCAAYEDYHSAQAMIDEEGEVINTHNGFRCQHPATKLKKDALARISEGLDKFGLNPRARKRMGADTPQAKDEDDGFAAFVG